MAQLCQNQQLWQKKYIELFGNPTTPVSNWKEAFYDAIGINLQAYVVKLRTMKPSEKYIEKNIAVIEIYEIDTIYDKLASFVNNNINNQITSTLKWYIQAHNNQVINDHIGWGTQPEVYKSEVHEKNELEYYLLELPISGKVLKWLIEGYIGVMIATIPEMVIEGPFPVFSFS